MKRRQFMLGLAGFGAAVAGLSVATAQAAPLAEPIKDAEGLVLADPAEAETEAAQWRRRRYYRRRYYYRPRRRYWRRRRYIRRRYW